MAQEHEYDPASIEAKWQQWWDEQQTFQAVDHDSRPPYYELGMFPYPSGAGLHIGHPCNYVPNDIDARFKRAQGYNVLHPIGWDAFGLPTEQYAIKTGEHPREVTKRNTDTFRDQLKQLGLGYDWSREVNTTDPGYFKWTQFIFVQLFKQGLAYVDKKPVWYCPELGTVLANEEVNETAEGPRSERGNFPVERRPLRQWVLKITAYAEKLLKGLDDLDWPESTKALQRNWIGKSVGAEVDFAVEGRGDKLRVFTTRPDTLFGVTYMVLAPEHPLVAAITTPAQKDAVSAYVSAAANKSDRDRAEQREKTGVATGGYAINPVNGERVPIWVADYVLISYGTGAIMAVPAHDERDFEFAQAFGLPIREVVVEERDRPAEAGKLFAGDGFAINSGEFSGLPTAEAKERIIALLEERKLGKKAVNYKLRDWLFSRQRYWGEPFPIVWISQADWARLREIPSSEIARHLPSENVTSEIDGETCLALPLPTRDLPLTLPEVASYQPAGTGESPLAKAEDWLRVWIDLETGKTAPRSSHPEKPGPNWAPAMRETNTMPQWAGSCWYYLRYIDPHNPDELIDANKERYWGMPNLYVGGAEHAVLHLLYARFWHRFLYDIGVVVHPEPFPRLFHQGIILGEDGEKMSKSRGNVINPETVIATHGCDTLRLYLMFLGPLEAMKPWSPKNIEGVSRFLKKLWRSLLGESGAGAAFAEQSDAETERVLHETIKKVTADYERLSYNTAISQLMICGNQLAKAEALAKADALALVQLLAPMAPHIAEELWERLGQDPSICAAPWPKHNEAKLVSKTLKLMVQVNGKLRGELEIDADAAKETILAEAKQLERVQPFLEGKSIAKEIYVPGKIVNLVVKG